MHNTAPVGRSANRFHLMPQTIPPSPFFERMVDAVKSREPFVYAKLNHGFWERLDMAQSTGVDLTDIDEEQVRIFEKKFKLDTSFFARDGFLKDLISAIGALPNPSSGFHFCASLEAWPYCYEFMGTPRRNIHRVRNIMNALVDPVHLTNAQEQGMTGSEFKTALIDGSLARFTKPLAKLPFALVARAGTQSFADLIGAKSMQFVEVPSHTARSQRYEIRDQILSMLAHQPDLSTIIINAGGSLTTWLCTEIHAERPDVQVFDIGLTLSATLPDEMFGQTWTKVYLPQMARTLNEMHSGWMPVPGTSMSENQEAPHYFRDERLVSFVEREASLARPDNHEDLSSAVAYPNEPIAFIENKIPDHSRVQQFLQLSEKANRYTNDGPVTQLLEKSASCLLNLPEGRCVLACSSATAGLFVAANLEAMKLKKTKLRWVTCAYTFFSTANGPFGDAILIDCDHFGRMSIDALKALDLESWDGLVFTNLFARHSDWSEFRQYCRDNGKAFIIDNAVGLLDRPDDTHSSGDIEVISCHHTKPWGVGEGGLILADKEDIRLMRDLINFSARLDVSALPLGFNGKLSDIAASYILDRIERMAQWGPIYQMQEVRIVTLLQHADIPLGQLMGGSAPKSPRCHLPLLSKEPVGETAFKNENVVLRKYYRPLFSSKQPKEEFPFANRLFERLVCCPCNPELRLVPTEKLASTFENIIEHSVA